MGTAFADCRLFFQEFLTNFHTTGAVLPSGRFLAQALTRFAAQRSDGPRQILEVGPGTGAVTRKIVTTLGPEDRLDLVELNTAFVGRLRERFECEPTFRAVADRARVLHCPVEELPIEPCYDVIISGLPLNNFAVEDVRRILDVLSRLLRPWGTLSFFEYIGLRRLKAVASRRSERVRLRGIGQVMGEMLHKHEIRCDWIWGNVPPAWVHHLRFGD